MWKEIESYVNKHHMIEEGDRIVLGLSGGADSVCLFMFLLHLKIKRSIEVFPVHVDHGIRGDEAERDRYFVETLCRKYQVPLKVYQEDIPGMAQEEGLSEEEAGRMVRYARFRQYLEEIGATKIAVAHHRDDQAETILFRLARGTGIAGLAGMRPVRGQIIRPFLNTSRSQILTILQDLPCDYVEDSTNEDDRYGRNRIRHQVLPALSDVNPAAAKHLAALGSQAAQLEDYLEIETEKCWQSHVASLKEGYLIRISPEPLHPVMTKRVLQEAMRRLAGCSRDISGVHVDSCYALMDKPVGSMIDLPYDMVARKTYDGILVGRPEETPEEKTFVLDREGLDSGSCVEIRWEEDVVYRFHVEEYCNQTIPKNVCVKYFDYDKIKSTVCLRTARGKDAFVMDRTGRKKTVRREFIDRKVPAQMRKRIPVLAQEDHVIWIGSGRVGYDFLVDENTKRILVGEILDPKQ